MWIFGYGSLIWRPGFPYLASYTGVITDWTRRFFQGSPDHRGVPGAPGRVATLLPAIGERCWGRLYDVDDRLADEVLAMLDHREQNGYTLVTADVDVLGAAPLTRVPNVRFYVANADNPSFLGPAPMEEMAAQVVRSSGPSGHNIEYVLRLAEALEEMQADDPHVFALAAAVRATSTLHA